MFRRNMLIGGGVAAALVVLVGGLYFLGGQKGSTGGFLERIASGFQAVTQIGSTSPSGAANGEFVFTRLDIDTTKAQAEACLAFSRDLDVTGRTHYEDYISID